MDQNAKRQRAPDEQIAPRARSRFAFRHLWWLTGNG
jgi:hypothetical protein